MSEMLKARGCLLDISMCLMMKLQPPRLPGYYIVRSLDNVNGHVQHKIAETSIDVNTSPASLGWAAQRTRSSRTKDRQGQE